MWGLYEYGVRSFERIAEVLQHCPIASDGLVCGTEDVGGARGRTPSEMVCLGLLIRAVRQRLVPERDEWEDLVGRRSCPSKGNRFCGLEVYGAPGKDGPGQRPGRLQGFDGIRGLEGRLPG